MTRIRFDGCDLSPAGHPGSREASTVPARSMRIRPDPGGSRPDSGRGVIPTRDPTLVGGDPPRALATDATGELRTEASRLCANFVPIGERRRPQRPGRDGRQRGTARRDRRAPTYAHRVRSFVLSVTGRDRPGIVSSVTRVLLDHALNLEDAEMAILRGHFAVMLVLAAPAEARRDGAARRPRARARRRCRSRPCR